MKKVNEIGVLLQMIDEGYSRRAWHGPNLKGALRGLTSKQAAWRLSQNRHNIWEIVVHCAYWKYIVRRRITREKKGSFPFKGSNWFRLPDVASPTAWKRAIRLLNDMHIKMVDAIVKLRLSDLPKSPQGSTWSTRATIYGIAMHDVYHAGQIQLLKRLMKTN